MRLCLLVISEVPFLESHQHDSPNVNKGDTNGHAKLDKEKATEASTIHKELQATEKGWGWESWASQREAHGLVVQLLKTFIQVTL